MNSWHQRWFIRFQNVAFISLVTDGRTDGRTDGQVENIMPAVRPGHSGRPSQDKRVGGCKGVRCPPIFSLSNLIDAGWL